MNQQPVLVEQSYNINGMPQQWFSTQGFIRHTKLLKTTLKHVFKGMELISNWYENYLQIGIFGKKQNE